MLRYFFLSLEMSDRKLLKPNFHNIAPPVLVFAYIMVTITYSANVLKFIVYSCYNNNVHL